MEHARSSHGRQVEAQEWRERFARGRVLDVSARCRTGDEIYYFREVPNEQPVPGQETVLYADEHLVVVDKPHFLPVSPTGAWVRETLLARLVRRLGNPDLVPLHRIDRETAGLVLFPASRESRARYQALFRERRIRKEYIAVAPALPGLAFPHVRRSRMERGQPFFRMREVPGEPNSETVVDVLERCGPEWLYHLQPITGRKHQLRVHMAALGAPICNDRFYPELREEGPDDLANPLQLFACGLSFEDPLTGARRSFSRP